MMSPTRSLKESPQAGRAMLVAYMALVAPAAVILLITSAVRADAGLAAAAALLLSVAVISAALGARLIRALSPVEAPAPVAFVFWMMGLALPVAVMAAGATLVSRFWLRSSALRDALPNSVVVSGLLIYAMVLAALLLAIPMVVEPDKLVPLGHRRGLVTERTGFAFLGLLLAAAFVRTMTEPERFASGTAAEISAQIPLLQREANRYPTHFLSQYKLGNALTRQRDCTAGLEPLRRAVALRPDDGWAQNDLAYALLCSRRYLEAIAPGREAMRLMPRERRPYYNLASAYEHLHDDADAADVYRRLLLHWPNEPLAMAREAFIKYRGGARKDALAELRRAMAIDDTSRDMRVAAGELFSSAAMLDEALKQYRAVAMSDSATIWSWLQYGSTAYLDGELTEANAAFDHVESISPGIFTNDSPWRAMRDAARKGIPPSKLPAIPPWDPHSDRTTLLQLP